MEAQKFGAEKKSGKMLYVEPIAEGSMKWLVGVDGPTSVLEHRLTFDGLGSNFHTGTSRLMGAPPIEDIRPLSDANFLFQSFLLRPVESKSSVM